MLTIAKAKQIKAFLIDNEIASRCEILADERQLPNLIGNNAKELALIVIPPSESDSTSIDDIEVLSQVLIFHVSSISSLGNNNEKFLEIMEQSEVKVHQMIEEFRSAVEDCEHNLHSIFTNWEPKFHIEPEYDLNGAHGWSLSFSV